MVRGYGPFLTPENGQPELVRDTRCPRLGRALRGREVRHRAGAWLRSPNFPTGKQYERFHISEAGHVALILPLSPFPEAKTAQASACRLSAREHLMRPALRHQDPSTLVLNVCSSAAGANPVAIHSTIISRPGGGRNDVLSAMNSALAAGLVLAAGTASEWTHHH